MPCSGNFRYVGIDISHFFCRVGKVGLVPWGPVRAYHCCARREERDPEPAPASISRPSAHAPHACGCYRGVVRLGGRSGRPIAARHAFDKFVSSFFWEFSRRWRVPVNARQNAGCHRYVFRDGHGPAPPATHPAQSRQNSLCTAARFRDTRLSLFQPSTSVAEYGWMASPVKAGLRPPPSAADGLDSARHPTIVCHQEFDGEERLTCRQVPMCYSACKIGSAYCLI